MNLNTKSFYEDQAEAFIDNTLDVDMRSLYSRFEKYLDHGDIILDLGCGSGRDLKYFTKNYRAIGLEPSKKLASFSSTYSNCSIINSTIQNFEMKKEFDGIWACASLLHIPRNELKIVFSKLETLLKKNGALYCSFKYGEFEGERNGRYFTDMTESLIESLLARTKLKIIESWLTSDLRKGRSCEKWLNCLISH